MWKSVCCEVQGVGHKKSNIPCQDKTFELVQNDVHIIALADGAGSASLSQHGAELVVRVAAEYMAAHFQELLDCDDGRLVKQQFLQVILDNLLEKANALNCLVRDLASTLLLAAVNSESFILAHIGDGVIGYLDADKLKVASLPDNGEFSNVTTFVTSDSALASMRLFKGKLKSKDAFVLMSDGTEQSLYHKKDKELANVIVKLMHKICLLDRNIIKIQLKKSFNDVISKNTLDDCSIAILARPSETLRPFDLLTDKERLHLYGFTEIKIDSRKRVQRYDKICELVKVPNSVECIARKIHLKPKYAKKYINKLISLGLIVRNGNLYQKV